MLKMLITIKTCWKNKDCFILGKTITVWLISFVRLLTKSKESQINEICVESKALSYIPTVAKYPPQNSALSHLLINLIPELLDDGCEPVVEVVLINTLFKYTLTTWLESQVVTILYQVPWVKLNCGEIWKPPLKYPLCATAPWTAPTKKLILPAYISVNMLSTNLEIIDISNNKIIVLP